MNVSNLFFKLHAPMISSIFAEYIHLTWLLRQCFVFTYHDDREHVCQEHDNCHDRYSDENEAV